MFKKLRLKLWQRHGYTVRIYGNTGCKYCQLAREYCREKGIGYHYIPIKGNSAAEELMSIYDTIPQIYLKKGDHYSHIGGYTQLRDKI